jgi:hypothetical protein
VPIVSDKANSRSSSGYGLNDSTEGSLKKNGVDPLWRARPISHLREINYVGLTVDDQGVEKLYT